MTETDKANIVREWVALQHAEEGSSEYESLLWSHDKLWEIAEDEPELCWELIIRILNTDQTSKVMEALSSGPLEDLLEKHGSSIIERVEAEAKMNSKFSSLLGGYGKTKCLMMFGLVFRQYGIVEVGMEINAHNNLFNLTRLVNSPRKLTTRYGLS